jgi:hypothetical protein
MGAEPPRHLIDARELVGLLAPENTSYRHGEASITWTGTRTLHADCSSFLAALLEHSYGHDRAAFNKWFGSRRPTAARFHDAIVEQHGFTRIRRLADVRPGDILAVEYLKRTDNTGHVMLAASNPRPMRPGKPVIAGTEQWEVAVIDSSKTGHGPADTRHGKGKGGKDHDGLGRGVLRVYTNRQGKVAGFSWSTLPASEFKSPEEEHLVIGRLQPNFTP